MSAATFVKNKTYYLQGELWKLKYIDRNLEGYYNFKVTEHDDTEEEWDEYCTKDGSEIVMTRKEWLETIKSKEDKDGMPTVLDTTQDNTQEV